MYDFRSSLFVVAILLWPINTFSSSSEAFQIGFDPETYKLKHMVRLVVSQEDISAELKELGATLQVIRDQLSNTSYYGAEKSLQKGGGASYQVRTASAFSKPPLARWYEELEHSIIRVGAAIQRVVSSVMGLCGHDLRVSVLVSSKHLVPSKTKQTEIGTAPQYPDLMAWSAFGSACLRTRMLPCMRSKTEAIVKTLSDICNSDISLSLHPDKAPIVRAIIGAELWRRIRQFEDINACREDPECPASPIELPACIMTSAQASLIRNTPGLTLEWVKDTGFEDAAHQLDVDIHDLRTIPCQGLLAAWGLL